MNPKEFNMWQSRNAQDDLERIEREMLLAAGIPNSYSDPENMTATEIRLITQMRVDGRFVDKRKDN